MSAGRSPHVAIKTRGAGIAVDCGDAGASLSRTSRGSHRRSQTIVAAGNLELQQLQKLMQMEVLQHDLESKSKELAESQEEAHLAALIGRSLLQRTEEMGAEIESTAMELVGRAESAEHEVKILEAKLSKAYAHIRSMEVAKAKTVDDSDEMTHELETLRVRTQVLKGEVAKAHDETQRVRAAKALVEDNLEIERAALATLRAAHSRALADFVALGKRVQELEATEQYNLEHISRLEIENQSICLQNRMQERREKKLVVENESMTSKLAAQRQSLRDAEVERTQLTNAVEALTAELDDVRDAFAAEQHRVSHLSKLNRELQDRVDEENKPDETHAMPTAGSPASSAKLRRGSLFYELSMQLKEEMRQAQQQTTASSTAHRDTEANQVHSEKSSPSADGVRAKPSSHPSLIPHIADDYDDDNNDSSSGGRGRVRRSPPSPPAPASASSPIERPGSPPARSQVEEDILKEFFMLTAAAVKIAGGGLGNDACNILNEDLYEEALNEGLTFDQYHKWLERRLEGEPESNDAAEKQTLAASSSSLALSGRQALRMAF